MMLPTNLVDSVREKRVILFVGAGVSMGLGLPSFSALINHLARELDYDPDVFETLGNHMTLAEYYKSIKGTIGPLRSWMDREWHKPSISIATSEVHKLIVDLDFPLIYTTNYDRWLELAFKHHGRPRERIANVGDLARAATDKPQIIKFHGDLDDDASIVLTESSYFDRFSFESPLDIKLRSDLLGRAVLFIGYSLTDINVRYLLYRLSKQWEATPYQQSRPRSYVFADKPNPVAEQVFRSRNIELLVSDSDDPGEGLRRFLTDLRDAVGVASFP